MKLALILLAVQKDLMVGGQAVMEGVMMRTPNAFAVAVRRRNGEIVRTAARVPRLTERFPILRLPVLRGSAALLQSMFLGVKALNFSANIAEQDAQKAKADEFFEKNGTVLAEEAKNAEKPRQSLGAAASIAFAVVFNVCLFIVAPLILTNALFTANGWADAPQIAADAGFFEILRGYFRQIKPHSWFAFNLFDGFLRLTFFLLMIGSVSLRKEIRRVFEYHGAEHKAIFAWEKGLDLTVNNSAAQTRFHPRCGTSFLLIVMLVAVASFSLINFDSTVLNLLVRIALLPLIIGISYETIRFSAKNEGNLIFKLMTAPGLWLQRLTTKEPDARQLEIALESLKASLELEPSAAPKTFEAAV